MGWNWWQRICEHNLRLRIPSPHPNWPDLKKKGHHQSGLLCGAALPELFSPEKTGPCWFCNLNQCFLHSTKTIFDGTRLDRRGLKSQCERFQYGTTPMARKFKNWHSTFFDYTFGTFAAWTHSEVLPIRLGGCRMTVLMRRCQSIRHGFKIAAGGMCKFGVTSSP